VTTIHRRRDAVRRFVRSPKGLLLIILFVLLSAAAWKEGLKRIAPGLLASVAAAMLVDAPILRIRGRTWRFPSGAILTALLVVMVLSPQEPWYVDVCTTVLAVVSKYLFRTHHANIFNPAALAIVATFYVFDTGQSWWGALGDLQPEAMMLLVTTGYFIADRVNKMPLVLAFLGSYFLLFSVTAFAGAPGGVAEIFRPPDLQAALFFAFFFLTDPPTSPIRYRHQLICGVIVAAASFVVFEWIGAVHYLLAGLLVGNLWEAARRWRSRRRTVPTGSASH
jgi:Na+-translocating ferredoxin:NAD+ oxidoreductase RnfD subunit